MSIDWATPERSAVDAAMKRYPVESGRCSALARVVYAIAQPRDKDTHGLLIRPKNAARFVVPKLPQPRQLWGSHTLVDAMAHRVDALTGTNGTPRDVYLGTHWEYPEYLNVERVDVFQVDPGIEEDA